MKNIINEKPTDPLYGRKLYSMQFVDSDDIKNKNVLDIGCGFAWTELNFLQRGIGNIIGIEVTEKDLETAKKYIKNAKVDFIVGSAIDLPFVSSSFNTVVSWEVIEHIPKNTEYKMFNEIHRVLKDNGVFYLSTPYDSLFSKIFDPAWWLIAHRHYSLAKFISLSKENGFIIEKFVVNGGWWEIMGVNNLYIAKWFFRRRPFLQKYFQRMVNKEYNNTKGFNTIFIKFVKI